MDHILTKIENWIFEDLSEKNYRELIGIKSALKNRLTTILTGKIICLQIVLLNMNITQAPGYILFPPLMLMLFGILLMVNIERVDSKLKIMESSYNT